MEWHLFNRIDTSKGNLVVFEALVLDQDNYRIVYSYEDSFVHTFKEILDGEYILYQVGQSGDFDEIEINKGSAIENIKYYIELLKNNDKYPYIENIKQVSPKEVEEIIKNI